MNNEIVIGTIPEENKEQPWINKELQSFRELVLNDKQLYCPTDDIFLLSFLRGRKFDRERAHKLLKNYYSARKHYTETFTNFNPYSVKKCTDTKIMGFLKHTDQNGRAIGIGRASHWDSSKFHVKEILRAMLVHLDLLLVNPLTQINGFCLILDAKKLSWRHIIQLTPTTAYLIVSTIFGSYPLRYKAIHVVNIGTLVQAFLAAFLPFLPYKLKKRIHMHQDFESLHKFIYPKYLPEDYGGELPPFDPEYSSNLLLEYQTFFEERERYWKID